MFYQNFSGGEKKRLLQQDIENDPIKKDQKANLSCLYCAPALAAPHGVKNVDLSNEQSLGNRSCESN